MQHLLNRNDIAIGNAVDEINLRGRPIVGVAVLIATPDKTTASPTKSRYSPSSTAKNIASASLYCGGKFENKTACYGGQPQGNQEQSKPRGKRTCHGLLRR